VPPLGLVLGFDESSLPFGGAGGNVAAAGAAFGVPDAIEGLAVFCFSLALVELELELVIATAFRSTSDGNGIDAAVVAVADVDVDVDVDANDTCCCFSSRPFFVMTFVATAATLSEAGACCG